MLGHLCKAPYAGLSMQCSLCEALRKSIYAMTFLMLGQSARLSMQGSLCKDLYADAFGHLPASNVGLCI